MVAAEENRGVANNGAVEPEEKYSTMNLLRMMEAASASPETMKKLGATQDDVSLLKACLGFGDKILAQKQEMAELERELQRIADVQREHKELYPPTKTEDCPICLETIQIVAGMR